jgi:hypothetical protein
MKIQNKSRLAVLAAAAAVLTLSGCVVAPAPYHSRERVSVAVGPPPVEGYIWWEGAWAYDGGHRRWVEGHWGPPRRY